MKHCLGASSILLTCLLKAPLGFVEASSPAASFCNLNTCCPEAMANAFERLGRFLAGSVEDEAIYHSAAPQQIDVNSWGLIDANPASNLLNLNICA